MKTAEEWSREVMSMINTLTPEIKGKALDVDWFLLRQKIEESKQRELDAFKAGMEHAAKINEQHEGHYLEFKRNKALHEARFAILTESQNLTELPKE